MWEMKVAFIFITFSIFARGQHLGDVCILQSSGRVGQCKLLEHCPKALEEIHKHRKFPQSCGGFQGTQPIVCCAKSERKPGEISQKKCQEYAEFAYYWYQPPVLAPGVEKVRRYDCGHEVVRLIIGGEPAGRKEFPHMVALGMEHPSGEVSWVCGGTILSHSFILTAAHCLSDPQQGNVTHVRMGVTDLSEANRKQVDKRQDFLIAERIAHPQYRYPSHYHDIGLIKLEREATLSPYARPACLHAHNEAETEKAIATGWGDTTVAGGSPSEKLLKVTLKLVDTNTCNETYKAHITRRFSMGVLGDIQMCASSDGEEIKDTCQGDSGGPLQVFHNEKHAKCMYDIIGITSFGRPCSGGASIYVRVAHYVKWIEDVVWPEN